MENGNVKRKNFGKKKEIYYSTHTQAIAIPLGERASV
jgi:hypothetical protein